MIGPLAGLLSAVAVVVLLRRWDVWRWLAVLAAVPVLVAVLAGTAATGWLALTAAALLAAGLSTVGWTASPPVGRLGPGVGLVALGGLAAAVDVLTGAGPLTGGLPAAVVVLVVPAGVGLLAAGGAGRADSSGLRLVCVLAVVAGLVGGPGSLTALAWLPAAGALGLTALLRGRRGAGAARPQSDDVDDAALAEFDRRYGTPSLAPVVVVIAAYNEERGIAGVLATLPRTACGLAVDVVVVDDGSRDETAAAVAGAARGRLVACGRNRGQGAALRLGYRVARERGATYVVTTDADGQYDPGDIEAVLAPLVEGRADFVSGSRLLGRQQTRDRVRRLGVHVFAWIVTALVGRRVTDTSFGLRAMRVEVTGAVTLNQPQYQSSELMLGAFSHGFRVLEVPGTMHVRSAGASKKGTNFVYGRSYAGVVLGTWWREGCPAPLHERAPAYRGAGARDRERVAGAEPVR